MPHEVFTREVFASASMGVCSKCETATLVFPPDILCARCKEVSAAESVIRDMQEANKILRDCLCKARVDIKELMEALPPKDGQEGVVSPDGKWIRVDTLLEFMTDVGDSTHIKRPIDALLERVIESLSGVSAKQGAMVVLKAIVACGDRLRGLQTGPGGALWQKAVESARNDLQSRTEEVEEQLKLLDKARRSHLAGFAGILDGMVSHAEASTASCTARLESAIQSAQDSYSGALAQALYRELQVARRAVFKSEQARWYS